MTDKQSAEIKQGLLAVKVENINIVGWDGISLMRNLFNIGFFRIKDNTYYYFKNGRVLKIILIIILKMVEYLLQ